MRVTQKAAAFITAAAFILLALYSLWLDRSASAGVAAAIALALLLLQNVAILESFEVLTLKVKLRAQVDVASNVIDLMRESALISARFTYDQMALLPADHAGWASRKDQLEAVEALLDRLDIGSERRLAMKGKLLGRLASDLSTSFTDAVVDRSNEYARSVLPRAGRQGDIFSRTSAVFLNRHLDANEQVTLADLSVPRPAMQQWFDRVPFLERDRAAFQSVLEHVSSLIEEVYATGRITQAAIDELRSFTRDGQRRHMPLGLPAVQADEVLALGFGDNLPPQFIQPHFQAVVHVANP